MRAPASRASAAVPSVEPPSTTRMSSARASAPRTTSTMVADSFFAGMRTVIRPRSGTVRAALLLPEGNELGDSALFELFDRHALLLGCRVHHEVRDPLWLLVDDRKGAGGGGRERNEVAAGAGGLELVVDRPDVILERRD